MRKFSNVGNFLQRERFLCGNFFYIVFNVWKISTWGKRLRLWSVLEGQVRPQKRQNLWSEWALCSTKRQDNVPKTNSSFWIEDSSFLQSLATKVMGPTWAHMPFLCWYHVVCSTMAQHGDNIASPGWNHLAPMCSQSYYRSTVSLPGWANMTIH